MIHFQRLGPLPISITSIDELSVLSESKMEWQVHSANTQLFNNYIPSRIKAFKSEMETYLHLTIIQRYIQYPMEKFNKGIIGAIIAGVIGIFLATVGFWRTLLILFLIIIGFLIGTYLDIRKRE